MGDGIKSLDGLHTRPACAGDAANHNQIGQSGVVPDRCERGEVVIGKFESPVRVMAATQIRGIKGKAGVQMGVQMDCGKVEI